MTQTEIQSSLLVGYARCSTEEQDLTAQRDALKRLDVPAARIYVDHGRTGAHRDRPWLSQALAAVREGDTLVVTKLDRLTRSVRDAADLADELTRRGVRLSIGGAIYDPTDPVGRLLRSGCHRGATPQTQVAPPPRTPSGRTARREPRPGR